MMLANHSIGPVKGRKAEMLTESALDYFAIARFALPYLQHSPTSILELGFAKPIALHVRGELGQPEVGTGLWDGGKSAVVAVPEASLHQDGSPVSWKHEIRTPGQILHVEPKPQTEPVRSRADDKFRLRVLAAYPSHHLTALGRTDNIHPANIPYL